MKILVTGSNGLLGQKITDLILLKYPDIALIATGIGDNRHPIKTRYVYEQLDVTDTEQIENIITKHQPNTIIHTAAMTNVDVCEQEQAKCWIQNVTAVQNLVSICELNNIHLIHLSTDFIFDGENGPYTEEAIARPLSFYGKSKLAAENIITQSKCKYAILRTILVYGITADMSRSNIVLWAKKALEKGNPINVVNDQWRTPTLAEDLAQGCLLVAIKTAQGVYNISGKDMMNMVTLVNKVGIFWKLNTNIVNEVNSKTLNQAAIRPPKTGFILEKSIRDLGYQPHSFEEGLAILDKQIVVSI